MLRLTSCSLFSALILAAPLAGDSVLAAQRPNVVLVMTDDQGYGDLSCHGNRQLETPHIDELYGESVRLTNFHVDPTCSPTRAALMTGKYSRRVGVWHTIMGRSLLPPDEVTMAEHFADAGYETAIFGKWHLGDNYPLRPQDQGFQHVLIHGGGGIGQTPDWWGNDYFDDTYQQNGHWRPFEGYCTDVWFREAERWLEGRGDQPFFLYLPTNAAHGPYRVPESYAKPFLEAGIPSPRSEFYGMIANIDENLGEFRAKLAELGLAENTIFIFMTDNGTAAGRQAGGFNAGMRAGKGSAYEGGHRVPCFIHWPAGDVTEGRDIDALTAHFDLLPTLANICDVPLENAEELDGRDLTPLLTKAQQSQVGESFKNRTLIVESQRVQTPVKWRKCSVMAGRWRLIDGKRLYDLSADPAQSENIAQRHPQVVKRLRRAYESWWEEVSVKDDRSVRIALGDEAAPTVTLTAHDWHPLENNKRMRAPWNQQQIANDSAKNGFWAVDIEKAGRYEFQLRRRPASDPLPIQANWARVSCGKKSVHIEIDPARETPRLVLELPAGPARLKTTLQGTDGKSRGAYYVTVRRLEPSVPSIE